MVPDFWEAGDLGEKKKTDPEENKMIKNRH